MSTTPVGEEVVALNRHGEHLDANSTVVVYRSSVRKLEGAQQRRRFEEEIQVLEAIEIALSDPMTSPELRGLPVDAEYGSSVSVGWRGEHSDAWKVSVDVSSLDWDMGYEGPGAARFDGEVYFVQHVQVPKVRAVVILVDDKRGQRTMSGTEAEPDGEHRIEWRRSGDVH